MALTVETGTGDAAAESYASVANLNAYATERGYTLLGDDTAKEAALRRATEFIETFYDRFKGYKLTQAQALQWPRGDVVIDGFDFAEDAIPVLLVRATCHAAYDIGTNGVNPFPVASGRAVVKQKVGPIERVFETGTSTAPEATLRTVEAYLEPLLIAGGLGIYSVRV